MVPMRAGHMTLVFGAVTLCWLPCLLCSYRPSSLISVTLDHANDYNDVVTFFLLLQIFDGNMMMAIVCEASRQNELCQNIRSGVDYLRHHCDNNTAHSYLFQLIFHAISKEKKDLNLKIMS